MTASVKPPKKQKIKKMSSPNLLKDVGVEIKKNDSLFSNAYAKVIIDNILPPKELVLLSSKSYKKPVVFMQGSLPAKAVLFNHGKFGKTLTFQKSISMQRCSKEYFPVGNHIVIKIDNPYRRESNHNVEINEVEKVLYYR